MQLETFDHTLFNHLPPIELADESMRETGKLALALRVLAPLFVENGLCDSWGIAILHKHWRTQPAEIPIQEIVRRDDGRDLITRPRTSFREPYWPSVLQVLPHDSLRLVPLEFSTDLAVRDANATIAQRQNFVSAFCSAMVAHSLHDTFSLVAIREAAALGTQLVELNFRDRSSVIREVPSAALEGQRLIQTSWRFSPGANASCEASCFVTCTVGDDDHFSDHTALHKPSVVA